MTTQLTEISAKANDVSCVSEFTPHYLNAGKIRG